MTYTKKYPQTSKSAAYNKFRRMAKNCGWGAVKYFECGFSTWWYGKSNPDDNFDNEYSIYVNTNYHSEETLNRMYENNCKFY